MDQKWVMVTRVTGYRLQGYRLQVTGYRLQGYRLQGYKRVSGWVKNWEKGSPGF
jgi:hypothetical protein